MANVRISFVLPLLFFIASGAPAQNTIKIPQGKPALVDGKCGAEEWKDAAELIISDNYKLYFKRTDDYVFVCVKPARETRFIVDLYLSPVKGELYTLHASAKLGERAMEGGKWKEWTDDWNWWDVNGWWANTLRPLDFEKKTFLPSRAIEFQIGRERFGGNRWRMMFQISDGSLVYPMNADNLNRETWLELDLGGIPALAPDAEEQVKAAMRRYERLTLEMDAEGIAAMFTSDGELINAGKTIARTPASIRAFLQSFDGKVRVEENADSIESVTVTGATAVLTGTYQQKALLLPDKREIRVQGKFEVEWSRQTDGQWLIRRMGTQSTPPR
jgi:uncharacterized protein (TIGR02246 family)